MLKEGTTKVLMDPLSNHHHLRDVWVGFLRDLM